MNFSFFQQILTIVPGSRDAIRTTPSSTVELDCEMQKLMSAEPGGESWG
jgi:hypothetical protein